MKGYYNRVDATNSTIKDGWLCTGDIGKMLDDGFFQIVDRKKDMINRGGEKISAEELKEILAIIENLFGFYKAPELLFCEKLLGRFW